MAKVTRVSPITGIERTMNLPQYDQDQFDTLMIAYNQGKISLEEAFAKCSPNAITFISSGLTNDEWEDNMFGKT